MSNTSRELTLFLRSAGFMAAVLALAGCSDSATAPGARNVVLQIASPSDGEEFEAVGGVATISMRVSATNFSGRIEALLDGEAVGNLDDAGAYTFTGVPTGLHAIGARAVNGDGTPVAGDGAEAVISIAVIGTCERDEDCDDGNACSLDTCGSGGLCQYSSIQDCDPLNPGAECKNDSDCEGKVDAEGPCKAPFCDTENGSICIVVPTPDGGSCDDGDACTENTSCSEGDCIGGSEVVCDDDKSVYTGQL